MKTFQILFAALLGLGSSSSALAQTTVPGTLGTPVTPGSPAAPVPSAIVPGQPGTMVGTTPASTVPGSTVPLGTTSGTVPMGTTSGTIATPGTMPNGTINDPAILRPGQDVSGRPATTPGTRVRRTTGSRSAPAVRP